MRITERQKKFCEEYLIDFNATAAYLRAGYSGSYKSANANGSKLLANTVIQAYLCKLREQTSNESRVSRSSTLDLVYDRAIANIADVVDFNASGSTLKASNQLPKSVSRGISSIKWTVTKEGDLYPSVTMKPDGGAIKILSDFYGLTSGFDQIREGLKKFGIAMVVDEESEIGWRLEKHEEA